MKAIVVKRNTVKYVEKKNPVIKGGGDVLLEVLMVGLCGSDVQRIDLILTKGVGHPTLGHEVVGRVVSVGKKVRRVRVGDVVVVAPLLFCGRCFWCEGGDIQHCDDLGSVGKTLDGGFAERVIVPVEDNLYKVKKNFNFQELVLADPLAVCIHAQGLVGNLTSKKIAIIGDGTIGEIFYRLALLNDAKEVVVFGRGSIIGKKADDYFDIVVDCVGRGEKDLINKAICLVRRKGTILVLGAYRSGFVLPVNARALFSKEIMLVGSNSYGFSGNKKDEFNEAVRLISERKLNLEGIITHKLPLDKFEFGLGLFRTKKTSGAKKIVFFPGNDFHSK